MKEIRRTKAFEAVLSTGNSIKIDEEEFQKVFLSIQSGMPVLVKQGLINPSFIVSIIPDLKRLKEWRHECGYSDGSGDDAKRRGLGSLEQLMPTQEELKIGSGNKLLN